MFKWIGLSMAAVIGLLVLAAPAWADDEDDDRPRERRVERRDARPDRGPAREADRERGQRVRRDVEAKVSDEHRPAKADEKPDRSGDRDIADICRCPMCPLMDRGQGRPAMAGRMWVGRRGFGQRPQVGSEFGRGRELMRGRDAEGRQPARDRQAEVKALAERMRPLLNAEQSRKLDELLKEGQPARPEVRRPAGPADEGPRPQLRRPESDLRGPQVQLRMELRRREAPDRPDVRREIPDRPAGPPAEQRMVRRVQELVSAYEKAAQDASPRERLQLQRKLMDDIRELTDK